MELPLVLQRRVAVPAAMSLAGTRLRLVSAHLDPAGSAGAPWLGARAARCRRITCSHRLADDTVILGADLNLGRGRYERAWRLLGEAGFTFGVPPTASAVGGIPSTPCRGWCWTIFSFAIGRHRRGGAGAPAGRASPGPGAACLRLGSSSTARPHRPPPTDGESE